MIQPFDVAALVRAECADAAAGSKHDVAECDREIETGPVNPRRAPAASTRLGSREQFWRVLVMYWHDRRCRHHTRRGSTARKQKHGTSHRLSGGRVTLLLQCPQLVPIITYITALGNLLRYGAAISAMTLFPSRKNALLL